MEYIRLCKGVSDKGILMPFDTDLYKLIKDSSKDYYSSIYKYNENHKQIFDSTGSISGIIDVNTNNIIFDFDSKDPSIAQEDAKLLVGRLEDRGISGDKLAIFFSGNKGFHIEIKTHNTLLPEEVKNIAIGLAGDLTSFDPVIYNPSRIIRIPFTRHQQTGLFKISLTKQELFNLNISQIKDLAKNEYEPIDFSSILMLPDSILQMKKLDKSKNVKKNTISFELPRSIEEIDWDKMPSFMTPERYVLSVGFFPPGSRHEVYMRLAAYYKYLKFDESQAYRLLKDTDEKQTAFTGQESFPHDELWLNIIKTVYSSSWKGGVYSVNDDVILAAVHEQLPPSLKRMNNDNYKTYTLSETLNSFKVYAENIDKNSIEFGMKTIDAKLRFQKGQLGCVLAPPGVGKTSMLIEVAAHNSKSDKNVLIFSMDMSENVFVQKIIQYSTGYLEDKVFDIFKNNNVDEIKFIEGEIKKHFGNAYFCFKSSLSLKDIRSTIKHTEDRSGKQIDLIGVDYLELIISNFSDPTQASAESIQGLREIAHDGYGVICLLQPNKISSTPTEPILSYNSAKGSSSIAQAASWILTCHRPGQSSTSPETDRYFSVNCVKNRMGGLFAADFSWEGHTGRIKELDAIGKVNLKLFRDMKIQDEEEAKEEKRKQWASNKRGDL